MRKATFCLCIGLCVIFSPAVGFATSQSEREVVLHHFAREEPSDRLRMKIAAIYVRALQATLRQQSVVLLDPDQFLQELPSDFGLAQAHEYRNAVARLCVDTLSDTDAATVASAIQQGGLFASDLTKTQHQLYADSFSCFSVKGSRWLGATEREWFIWPEPYRADLVRILAMPGIAKFPNRIVKQNILHGFQ